MTGDENRIKLYFINILDNLRCGIANLLLPAIPQIRRLFATGEIAAPMIDVQAAAPGVTGIYRQVLRFALAQQVHENPLHALFMKLVVLAKTDQIFEQPFLIDRRANIVNLNAAPIRLSGHHTIRFQ